MVIGLTGRYCSGKGTAAAAFASRGFAVVDADELSHEVLAERAAQVIAEFGSAVRALGGSGGKSTSGRLTWKKLNGLPAASPRASSDESTS